MLNVSIARLLVYAGTFAAVCSGFLFCVNPSAAGVELVAAVILLFSAAVAGNN